MITGLFETHIDVESLEKSIAFYRDVMELELAHIEEGRRIAFFWIGGHNQYMLGLWEKPKAEIHIRHFAFRCGLEDVLKKSEAWLTERRLQPYNFLKDGSARPMVFAWMPALAIYFTDPDGHILEFIAPMEGKGRPEMGVMPWEEWMKLN